MEPTTALLIAGFLMPYSPTRFENWFANSYPNLQALSRVDSTSSPILFPVLEPLSGALISKFSAAPSADLDRVATIGKQLRRYEILEDGWDGDDSRAPAPAMIELAENFLNSIPAGLPLPTPMVSANGSVGLYWDIANAFADVVFEEDGHFSLFIRCKNNSVPERFFDAVPKEQISASWIEDKLASLLA